MKPPLYYFQLLPVLAVGFLFSPITAQAQDAGREPGPRDAPNGQPAPEQVAPPAAPPFNPSVQPNWHQGQQRPLARPNPAGAPERPANAPHPKPQANQAAPRRQMPQAEQAAPQQPMAQPGWPGPQAGLMFQGRMQRAWGPQTAQSNTHGRPPQMARNQGQGGQNGAMFQPRTRGAWGPQMGQQAAAAGPQQRMGRGQNQCCQNRPMFQARTRGAWGPQMGCNRKQGGQARQMFQARMRGGWGPQMGQPQFAGPPQRMGRPNALQAPAKPGAATENSPVARIRHLRQAAAQLTAAGYPEYAAKARSEISRLEGELKLSKPATPPPANQPAPRRDFAPQQVKPDAKPALDANAAMLNEMRQLSKQIEQLNGRMQKLEARGPQ